VATLANDNFVFGVVRVVHFKLTKAQAVNKSEFATVVYSYLIFYVKKLLAFRL
jgi:hypothetical protein